MYVQRLKDYNTYTAEGEPVLDTFGEVQQLWHPWRRRYDLFLRCVLDTCSSFGPVLTLLQGEFQTHSLSRIRGPARAEHRGVHTAREGRRGTPRVVLLSPRCPWARDRQCPTGIQRLRKRGTSELGRLWKKPNEFARASQLFTDTGMADPGAWSRYCIGSTLPKVNTSSASVPFRPTRRTLPHRHPSSFVNSI